MPLPVWLPTWLTNFLGAGWIRGLLGIRKDLVDTKKAKLEVKKLQHEERTRNSLITPATFDDVKKYDPKYAKLEKEILDFDKLEWHRMGRDSLLQRSILFLYKRKLLLLIITICFVLAMILMWYKLR